MRSLRYGISTWNYLKPFGERARLLPALRQLAAAGLGAELWLDWSAEPLLFARHRWSALKEIADTLRPLSAHSRLIHRFDPAVLREEIDLCAFLGADPLVLHPRSLGLEVGTWDASAPSGLLGAAQTTVLAEALKHAAAHGVRLALENGPMEVLDQVLEAADRFAEGDTLGICIDTGHANLHRDRWSEPAPLFVRRFASRLFHLHLSDNGGQADDHTVPGRGTIDWKAVTAEILSCDYRETIVLELWSDSPEEAASQAMGFLAGYGLAPAPRPR